MSATEFLLYCCGVGIVIISMSLAIIAVKLIKRSDSNKQSSGDKLSRTGRTELPTPDNDLASRLQEFQSSRFASPIITRRSDPTGMWTTKTVTRQYAPPAPPKPSVSNQPATPVRPPLRAVPKQNEKKNDNVVSLPLKQKKDDNKE